MKFSLSVAVLVVLLSSLALVSSISLPVSSLWRGYNILYVPVAVGERDVLRVLEEAGVSGAVARSEQRQPLFSAFAPVQSISGHRHSYLSQRENYFFDRSRQMRLFYIPTKAMGRGLAAARVIQGLPGGEGAGLEGRVAYPWVVPLVALTVLLVLAALSKARDFMLVSGLFPLLFCCCLPSHSGAAAVSLLLCGFFLCGAFWRRRDMLKAVLGSSPVLLFCLSGILVAFVGSWREGLLFVAAIAASLALCHLFARHVLSREKGFLLIRSAQAVPVASSVPPLAMLIPAAAAGVLSASLFFFGYFPADTSISGLFLPAPARYTGTMSFDAASFQDSGRLAYPREELPSLVHYVDWVWDTVTYPYRPLHEPVADGLASVGEEVLLPRYQVGREGEIRGEWDAVHSLDESFISSVMEGIQDGSLQIEGVLKAQGCFTSVVYRRMGDFQGGGFRGQLSVLASLLATAAVSLAAGIFIWRSKK